MDSFDTFEQNLLEMLNHLYDPVYRPPDWLWARLGVQRESGLQALRDAILAGIEDLKPPPHVPATTRAWRVYGMLRYRYVDDLSQEATAEKLGMTSRHLRRTSQEAVRALSLSLWEKSALPSAAAGTNAGRDPAGEIAAGEIAAGATGATATGTGESAAGPESTEGEASWHHQLAREMEALEETAAGAVSNVAETVQSVLRLAAHLTNQRGVTLTARQIPPQLIAAIHPSVLRQVLITIIDAMARRLPPGEIVLEAKHAGDRAQITLCGGPVADTAFGEFEPIRALLSSFNIAAELERVEGRARFTLEPIQVDRCVLVVDDNTDMAHLYRRYLAGTRYYVQHVSRGEKAFAAIEQFSPQVVVLDVMLPDMDGWDLLSRMHENPPTRGLPVVICSVMREKELAFALGARYFLSKPVQRRDFLTALDTVLQQA